MNINRLLIFAFLISGSWISKTQAQESTNTTGGTASGEGGSVSYSVGQTVYSSHEGSDGSLIEGVLQPFEISVVAGDKASKAIALAVSAYPNPTRDFLTLSFDAYDITALSYKLYDTRGKLLKHQIITASPCQVDMSGLNAATYFLKVVQENKEIKTFKIIKNK